MTHEEAVGFLQESGWLQDHDEQIYEQGKRDGIEWHPYPKEKPTESGEYNVTIRNVNVVILATYDAKHDSWEVPNTLVIAWTDLMKPYEEGAE